MTDIDKLRSSKPYGRAYFYLYFVASLIWVVAACFSAFTGNLNMALLSLVPVPFLLGAGVLFEQVRMNRVLLEEIDSLRGELLGKSKA